MFSLIAMLGEFLEFDTLLTDKINVKWFKKRPSIFPFLKNCTGTICVSSENVETIFDTAWFCNLAVAIKVNLHVLIERRLKTV